MHLTFLMFILCSATLKVFYKVCRVFYYKSCHLQIEMTGLLIDQFCPLILTSTFGTILNIMASLLVSNFRKKKFSVFNFSIMFHIFDEGEKRE